MTDIDDFESSYAYDQYILASLMLPKDYGFNRAKVDIRKHNSDGIILGSRHSNSFLDDRFYNTGFKGGATKDYAKNIIAGKIYSPTNTNGK